MLLQVKNNALSILFVRHLFVQLFVFTLAQLLLQKSRPRKSKSA